jgi:hypothetical protein
MITSRSIRAVRAITSLFGVTDLVPVAVGLSSAARSVGAIRAITSLFGVTDLVHVAVVLIVAARSVGAVRAITSLFGVTDLVIVANVLSAAVRSVGAVRAATVLKILAATVVHTRRLVGWWQAGTINTAVRSISQKLGHTVSGLFTLPRMTVEAITAIDVAQRPLAASTSLTVARSLQSITDGCTVPFSRASHVVGHPLAIVLAGAQGKVGELATGRALVTRAHIVDTLRITDVFFGTAIRTKRMSNSSSVSKQLVQESSHFI